MIAAEAKPGYNRSPVNWTVQTLANQLEPKRFKTDV